MLSVSVKVNERAAEQFAKKATADVIILQPERLREKMKNDMKDCGKRIGICKAGKQWMFIVVVSSSIQKLFERISISSVRRKQHFGWYCETTTLERKIWGMGRNY